MGRRLDFKKQESSGGVRRLENIHRILFIRTDRIGDTLMNVPAIHLLRQTYPKAWITLLCDRKVADLFRGHPDLDEVMGVDLEQLKKDVTAAFGFFKKIRKAKFQLAVISNPGKFFHLLSFLAGIRHRVGYRRKWGFLLNHSLSDDKHRAARHEIESNLNLVRLVSDIEWDGAMPLAQDEKAKAKVEDFLSRRGADEMVIAFHVGTTNPKKRWPIQRFSELADKIQADGDAKVVLVGGPEEREAGVMVFRQTHVSVVDAIGAFSLRELAAFLGRDNVKALISSDSGPAHLAWMQGTPTVVFFAKDVPGCESARWGPRDGRSEVIEKPVLQISVQEAFQALERVLCK